MPFPPSVTLHPLSPWHHRWGELARRHDSAAHLFGQPPDTSRCLRAALAKVSRLIPSTTITIELFGSYGARHNESGTTIDLTNRRNRATTKSPIPVLCRELIAHGHDPQDRVHIVRKSLDRDALVPVLNRDRPLAKWAAIDIVETEAHGPRSVPYRPFPDALKGKDKRKASGLGKSTGNPEGLPKGNRATSSKAA